MQRLLRQLQATVALLAAAAGCYSVAAGVVNAQTKSAAKTAQSNEAQNSEASPQRRQKLQSEQRQLQQRLAKLKQQLADSEASHSEAADALSESERSISATNRHLRELADARRQVERQISGAQERGRGVGQRQSEQERLLSLLLRTEAMMSRQSAWQSWLAGESPGALARDLRYLEIATQARAAAIADLRDRREELHQLEVESLARQAELAAIAQQEKQARSQLLQQQNVRKQTLARLARQISGQRQTIASLERDDQRLAGLVEQLTRLLAQQARRAEQSRRAPVAPPARTGADTRNATSAATDFDPPAGSKLAALRAKMQLPVRGEVVARFGATRMTEAGVNAPTWKGVLIRAAQGSDVRCVAAGRVVFADWLRGFGNLLIVDHGDGLLSVYGNNESLLRSVGDRVEADEVVSSVGNTGGNTESGLYFELRFEGRPIDPLKWAQAR